MRVPDDSVGLILVFAIALWAVTLAGRAWDEIRLEARRRDAMRARRKIALRLRQGVRAETSAVRMPALRLLRPGSTS